MRSIPVHDFAETKLRVKPYKDSAKLYPETDVPTGIKPVVIQSVITECTDFLIPVDIDTSNGCLAVKFGITAYAAGKIRTGRNDKIGIVCNIKTKLHINGQFQIKLVDFHICIRIYDVAAVPLNISHLSVRRTVKAARKQGR